MPIPREVFAKGAIIFGEKIGRESTTKRSFSRLKDEIKQGILEKVSQWNYDKVSPRCIVETFGIKHGQAVNICRQLGFENGHRKKLVPICDNHLLIHEE